MKNRIELLVDIGTDEVAYVYLLAWIDGLGTP